MEEREDLRSILPYLPLVLRSSSLFWPSQVVEALKALSRGPDHSKVDSGELLFLAISDIRHSLTLTLSAESLASSAADGYALFFDDLMSRAESAKWFGEVVPALANLLLRLPLLLETHYQNADELINGGRDGVKTGLRLLDSQEPGIVFLSQELTGALLACSFFCLFPITDRGAKHLPTINFDHLFASLYDMYNEKQENKIKCIIHYFERICSCLPLGVVSFERKVLPLECIPFHVCYPKANIWSKSIISLCRLEVYRSGLIENQPNEALEVDFANKYIGGGALHRGCVQEEIRFMINPELIAGMLFLPSMADNEAVEIVGTERFSNYTGLVKFQQLILQQMKEFWRTNESGILRKRVLSVWTIKMKLALQQGIGVVVLLGEILNLRP
uniref:poly(ADP-ribose) glycohydrolase n=1 Tax=Davidia involucrata TaxID=16924 RepID=A0A5B6ZCL6_DAVIN